MAPKEIFVTQTFAIFGKIRKSLFPQNICFIAKVYSRKKNKQQCNNGPPALLVKKQLQQINNKT